MVLHVIDSLAAGGAERMLVELVNSLRRSGESVAVCVTRSDTTLADVLVSGVAVHRLGRTATWDLGGLRRFAAIVREGGVRVVHAHGYSSFRFAVAAKALGRLSVPVVLHVHSSDAPGRATRWAARAGAAHVIAVAEEAEQWAGRALGGRVTLLGNAIDPRPYRDARPADLSGAFPVRPRLVGAVVANVRPVKSLETLFDALARSRHRDDLGIVVAGMPADLAYSERCHARVAELGLRERVAFLGSRGDVPSILAAADFGLLSSARETGPVALLEYLAAGLPFVVTAVGQVTHGAAAAGLEGIVPVGDSAAFAEALDRLLDASPAERLERGERGRRFLESNGTVEARCEQLRQLYRTLAGA
jgi:glycosyltransferase involved in cell wall biosynthesis